jgi:hypothetical protein
MKKQHQEKPMTFENLISSPNYQQLRQQIIKEINTFCPKISFEIFKKSDEEKAAILTAKKNWKGNSTDFTMEFPKHVPNFGAFKFNGITIQ